MHPLLIIRSNLYSPDIVIYPNDHVKEKIEQILKDFNKVNKYMKSELKLTKNELKAGESTRKSQEEVMFNNVNKTSQIQTNNEENIKKMQKGISDMEDKIISDKI